MTKSRWEYGGSWILGVRYVLRPRQDADFWEILCHSWATPFIRVACKGRIIWVLANKGHAGAPY